MASNSPSDLKIDKTAFSTVSLGDEADEKVYWRSRSSRERLRHVEVLRRINYGDHSTARLQRVLEIVQLSRL